MTGQLRDMIAAFSNANGVSGFEDEVLEVVRRSVGKTIRVEEDSLRNLYLHPKTNTGDRPVVMLDGHTDEVGFMVQMVNPNGTLKFVPLGGWMAQVVMGIKVRVRSSAGHYVTGVIGARPPHFSKASEQHALLEIEDMFIDVGASSRSEIEEEFGIEPGAPVVPDVTFSCQKERSLMMGKAFDCRLGCAALVETLNRLSGVPLNVDIIGTLSSQEEVGLRGARVSARRVDPDAAIIFEGTPADDTFLDSDAAQSVLRKGPQIRHRDNSMIANPRFVKFAREVAKGKGIPFQDAVRTSGGTNGGMVHLAGRGVPVVVLGVPVRYIHAPYGIATMEDFNATVDWACEMLQALDAGIVNGL